MKHLITKNPKPIAGGSIPIMRPIKDDIEIPPKPKK